MKQEESKMNGKLQRNFNKSEIIRRQTTEIGISLVEPEQALVMNTTQTFEPKSYDDEDQSSDSSQQLKVEQTKQIVFI